MNRSTALLLALTALLAHLLTVHQNAVGRLGPAFDDVHVAFRMGRMAVHGPTGGAGEMLETYPSVAWVMLAAVAERLYWYPTSFAQFVAVLAALASVWVVSRFSPARLAGVIAPLLCVVSGPIAASASGGSEFALFTLCVAAAFLAFEHGRSGALAAALIGASLTRPEGLLVAIAFLALFGAVRVLDVRSGGRRIAPFAFVAAFLLEAVLALVRWKSEGHVLSPTLAGLLTVDVERYQAGLAYVQDFVLRSGAPLLVVVPIVLAVLGRLEGRAMRALALALAWIAYIALQGGSTLPFWVVLAPALPLLFLSVQDALIVLIDDGRVVPRRAAWVLFAGALFTSTLASKLPNDVGPVPLAGIHRAWLGDERVVSDDPLELPRARGGLQRAVRDTERLRALGIFVRDQIDPRASVASPWPGAVSYLSRRTVHDLLGRSTPLPGAERTRPWYGPPRTDLVAAMSSEADYVVPFLLAGERAPRVMPFIQAWFRRYDVTGADGDRMLEFWEYFSRYELIAVPVGDPGARRGRAGLSPFYLLRHHRLGLGPELSVTVDGRKVAVEALHAGHPQLADLEVVVRDGIGQVRSLRPTGNFAHGRGVHARTNLLLTDTGDRTVRLLDTELPGDFRALTLTAVLRNPGSQGDQDFSRVSNEVVVSLKRDP